MFRGTPLAQETLTEDGPMDEENKDETLKAHGWTTEDVDHGRHVDPPGGEG
jgi:hypothetical protein